MTNTRRRREHRPSVLAQMLAARLQELERESPTVGIFAEKISVGRATYFDLVNAQGNPTLQTIEHVAARLDQSLFELIGFTDVEVRRAAKRIGINYDELDVALAEDEVVGKKVDNAESSSRSS